MVPSEVNEVLQFVFCFFCFLLFFINTFIWIIAQNFCIVLPFPDDNYIIQSDGILIKRVTEADEGTYRCRARVLELGTIDSIDIQVEVYIPPQINILPKDSIGIEKDSVTFECKATGKPAPSYTWVNNDNEPLETMDNDYFVDKDKGTLTIINLKPEYSGKYWCTATNLAGEDTAEANLLVFTKPKVEQFLNLTVPVDHEAEFRCIVTGDPAPQIVFKKQTLEAFQPGFSAEGRIEVKQETDEQGREVGM